MNGTDDKKRNHSIIRNMDFSINRCHYLSDSSISIHHEGKTFNYSHAYPLFLVYNYNIKCDDNTFISINNHQKLIDLITKKVDAELISINMKSLPHIYYIIRDMNINCTQDINLIIVDLFVYKLENFKRLSEDITMKSNKYNTVSKLMKFFQTIKNYKIVALFQISNDNDLELLSWEFQSADTINSNE